MGVAMLDEWEQKVLAAARKLRGCNIAGQPEVEIEEKEPEMIVSGELYDVIISTTASMEWDDGFRVDLDDYVNLNRVRATVQLLKSVLA
jgi:hypothetical protein